MKSAQLPPVRIETSIRREIEAALREGESLSEFVVSATLEAARRRQAQEAFLARGRASLDHALQTGEFYEVEPVVEELRQRLRARLTAIHAAAEPAEPTGSAGSTGSGRPKPIKRPGKPGRTR
jgi:Arc/MetJ-type ribon-helix-helix transcriptional regulator